MQVFSVQIELALYMNTDITKSCAHTHMTAFNPKALLNELVFVFVCNPQLRNGFRRAAHNEVTIVMEKIVMHHIACAPRTSVNPNLHLYYWTI